MRSYVTFCVLALLMLVSFIHAGTTGKIAGTVLDGQTGERLIGVNVIVKDSYLGASTDLEGDYIINNVPPGIYTLEVMYIGYQTVEITDVRVSIDLTTKINVEMNESALETTEVVTVIAERPVIQQDLTATTSVVDGQEIAALPVTEVSEVLELQAGYVDGHMRGGRSGEVAIWIDGIPITDAYDGGSVVNINKDMVSELQVISGAFNAEYGNAMSGIVNIVTKDGADHLNGSFTTYFGDNLSSNNDIFWDVDSFDPTAITNFDFSLNGPIIKDNLYFFLNGRHVYFDGWLSGKEEYRPGNISLIDSAGAFVASRDASGRGNGDYVPMNWNRKNSGQFKLLWKIAPGVNLTSSTLVDLMEFQDYDRSYKLNPDGNLQRFNTGIIQMFKLTHALTPETFYDFGVTGYFKEYKHYAYEDQNDPRYVHPNIGVQFPFSFKTGGTNNNRFKRQTKTYLAKFDLTSQVSKVHQLKTGLEFKTHELFFENINLLPVQEDLAFNAQTSSPYIETEILPKSSINTAIYTRKPMELSFYVQDKMEFEDFIVNVGVRFDYFDPDGQVLADPSDPQIYSPVRPENRYKDLNGNGQQDAGEPDVTVEERQEYWYKDVDPKFQFSPRIGAAFPISSRGKIYFSYGYFFQRPSFELLYTNPDYDVPLSGIGLMGNADLSAEKTVQGELGIQQQITDDISVDATVFFRDVRDLTGTRADLIPIFGSGVYSQYKNSDFGLIKGFVLAFNKRFSGGISARLDYTYQKAQGTASNTDDALNATRGGQLPDVQIKSLNWDQRHTINGAVSYNAESWGASLIAQYGSGLPYTPRSTIDISSILTNSEFKPSTNNVDVKLYKTFEFSGLDFNAFVRIFNLFDRLNELQVYNDTGRADETTDIEDARKSTSGNTPVNTLEEWFTNATFYSEPRRVEFGVTVNF